MPSSHQSRDSAGTASSKSKWRNPEFLRQIRSGGSKGRCDERYSSPPTSSSSPTHGSPVRRESITITRTTSYGKDQDQSNGHSPGHRHGGSRPPVSRRVSISKSDYPAHSPHGGQPLSRQVPNSGSNSPAYMYSGVGGQPVSRQVSNSGYSPRHPNVPNGSLNGRPPISRQDSCSKHPNCQVDETRAGYTIHTFKTGSRQSSVDRHSQHQSHFRSTTRDGQDDTPSSRHGRGRSSSISSRHSPLGPNEPERDRDREVYRGDGTPRRRGSSRRPDYKLSSDVYDPARDTRRSMDQRRFSSSSYVPGPPQRFSIDNFNPLTMDLVRFRRDGGGTETNIRERFDVRPKCTYGSATNMLRTSPYHYAITNPEGRVVWRSRCPHTDPSPTSERCTILHTNIDPSTIFTIQIPNDDYANYTISLLSPSHPGVRGAELNSDFAAPTLEDKVREMEVVQQDMAKRFIEWSHTPEGKQRLNLESVFLQSCERLARRKGRLERYRTGGLGVCSDNRNSLANGTDDPIRKGFRGLSSDLEDISKRLQGIRSASLVRHPQRSDTAIHAGRLEELINKLDEEMNASFSEMRSLAVGHMSALTQEKSSGLRSMPPPSTNPDSTRPVRDSLTMTNGTSTSRVQFRTPNEPHRTDTLGQSLPSTISTITAPGRAQVSMGIVASPLERATKIATKTDETLQSFAGHVKRLKGTISELVKLSTKRDMDTYTEREQELQRLYEEMVGIQIRVDALKESVQRSQRTWMDEEEEQIRSEEDSLRVFRDSLLS